MTEGKTQMSIWLPDDLARWLRVTAAARGITRSQLVLELLEQEQREESR
jgi:hypothetical protein